MHEHDRLPQASSTRVPNVQRGSKMNSLRNFLLLILILVSASIAQAQSAANAINGVYNGTYNCALGPRTLKLSLLASGNGSLTGVFTFYLPPDSHTQAFSYSMSGTFDAAS